MAKSVKSRCWVELDKEGIARIFRNYSEAVQWATESIENAANLVEFSRREAVKQIRERVFKASNGYCRNCNNPINWNFHMHEQIKRGQGGEISIYNSVALCARCHLIDEHPERQLRFGEHGSRE